MSGTNPFIRLKESCNISSLDFSEAKNQESAFLENIDVIIPSNVSLPVTIDNNIILKYAISSSPLFINPLQMFHHVQLRILKWKADTGTYVPIDKGALVAPVVAPLYTMVSKLDLWANGCLVGSWNNYNYICFIIMMLFYDLGYIKSVLQTQSAFSLDT